MHGFYPNKFEAMLIQEYRKGQRKAYRLGRGLGFKEGAKYISKQAIEAIDEIASVYRSLPFEEGKTEAFIQSLEERQKRLGKLLKERYDRRRESAGGS